MSGNSTPIVDQSFENYCATLHKWPLTVFCFFIYFIILHQDQKISKLKIIQLINNLPGQHTKRFAKIGKYAYFFTWYFAIVYLDDILIYNKDPGQGHVEAVWRVFEELKKYSLFANLKKSQFPKDKVCFLGYVVSAQRVRMEDKRIEAIKNWSESKSIRDIQNFININQ